MTSKPVNLAGTTFPSKAAFKRYLKEKLQAYEGKEAIDDAEAHSILLALIMHHPRREWFLQNGAKEFFVRGKRFWLRDNLNVEYLFSHAVCLEAYSEAVHVDDGYGADVIDMEAYRQRRRLEGL